MGDSYAGSGKGGNPDGGKQATNKGSQSVGCLYGTGKTAREAAVTNVTRKTFDGIKAKDLIGIPWMVAFALRADGWYLRQDIVWHKPNPMPESVRDRCTKAHEYIFLMSKSERYYFDGGVIAEPCVCTEPFRFVDGGQDKQRGHSRRHAGFNGRYAKKIAEEGPPKTRNKRSVWTVATKPYKGAHFATFPPDLIEPCVLAGCPAGGVVLDPFFGSGTTGQVAQKNGRRYIGIELNPAYEPLAKERVQQTALAL
mgnify:FL=1